MSTFNNEELLYLARLLETEHECNENPLAMPIFEKIHAVIRPLREGDSYTLAPTVKP